MLSFLSVILRKKKTIIIAFMDKGALDNFRNSYGWKIGVDASVAVIELGVDGSDSVHGF